MVEAHSQEMDYGGTDILWRYCTFVPPIIIDDSSWKNMAESFAVALTLTLGGGGGTKVQ